MRRTLWISAALLLASCGGGSPVGTAGEPPSTTTGDLATTVTQSGATTDGSAAGLSVGDCLIEETIDYQGEKRPALTDTVPCAEPHAAEVVAMMSGDSFLAAREECKTHAASAHPEIPQEMFYVFGPNERTGTEYACLYNSEGQAGTLAG